MLLRMFDVNSPKQQFYFWSKFIYCKRNRKSMDQPADVNLITNTVLMGNKVYTAVKKKYLKHMIYLYNLKTT